MKRNAAFPRRSLLSTGETVKSLTISIGALSVIAVCIAGQKFPSEIKVPWRSVDPNYTVLKFSEEDRRLTVTTTFDPDEILYSGTNYQVFVRVFSDGDVQAFGIEPYYTWVIARVLSITDGVTNFTRARFIVDGVEQDMVEGIKKLSEVDPRFEVRSYERETEQSAAPEKEPDAAR